MLFSWYYKGFELLWRYLVKHPVAVDLEVVDKEMATDEAAQAAIIAPEGNVRSLLKLMVKRSAFELVYVEYLCFPFLFSFLGAQCVFGFIFILMLEQYFLPDVLGLLIQTEYIYAYLLTSLLLLVCSSLCLILFACM